MAYVSNLNTSTLSLLKHFFDKSCEESYPIAYMNLESLNNPIPVELPSLDGWKQVPIIENNESLVALGPFSDYNDIFTNSIYFGERSSPYLTGDLKGSLITMFAREGVARRLRRAQQSLPSGMRFVVYDAYRTLDVQQVLFDKYFNELKSLRSGWTEDDLIRKTQIFVSLPSTDSSKPSPHNTGGSVDLAIIQLPELVNNQILKIEQRQRGVNLDWNEAYELEMQRVQLLRMHGSQLDFGTSFDHGGEKSYLNHFEKLAQERDLTPNELAALNNRRILYNIMLEVGMQPYKDEWWHFNAPESQMGAKLLEATAEYGAIDLSEENLKHEQMRRDHFYGNLRLLAQTNKFGIMSPILSLVRRSALATGDWRSSTLPPAEILTPSA